MIRMLLFFLVVALGVMGEASRFIVTTSQESVSKENKKSRNEVKEDIGNSLHAILITAATIQSTIGKIMMYVAAFEKFVAEQPGSIAQSSDTSTALSAAQSTLGEQVIELQEIGSCTEELVNCIKKTVSLQNCVEADTLQESTSQENKKLLNKVKEQGANPLCPILTIAATLQSAVGKMMMYFAALQGVIAEQAGNLVEDGPPFDSASTATLSATHSRMVEHIDELQEIAARTQELAAALKQTVSL